MSQPWVPAGSIGEAEFLRLRDVWLVGDRRTDPCFVPHLPDDMVEHLPSNGKAYEVLSKPAFGLRGWRAPKKMQ